MKNKIHRLTTIIAIVAFLFFGFGLTSCHGPFSNMQSQIDELGEDIARIDADLDTIRAELDGIQAWMIATDAQLLSAFQLIADNAAAITQLRQDMEDGDQNLQNQLDDLLVLFWQRYSEVSNRIDDVIFQQNQDRQQFQQGLVMAMTGLAVTNWRVTQLEIAFQNASSNFQNQLNDLRDDLNDLEVALRAEIQDLATDIAANATQIANLWTHIADTFANYYTAAQVDAMLDLIDNDIVAVRNRLDNVEADLATKITLLEAEQETYRILFGDNAMNPDGSLKPYFANQMYWNDNFQGFSRVVNSIFYQVASAINNPGHTPPLHVAQSLANALLNYFATIDDLNLLEGEVAGLTSQVLTTMTNVNNLAVDIGLNEAEINNLISLVAALTTRMDASEGEITLLATSLMNLTNQVNTNSATIANIQMILTAIQNQTNANSSLIAALQILLNELRSNWYWAGFAEVPNPGNNAQIAAVLPANPQVGWVFMVRVGPGVQNFRTYRYDGTDWIQISE